MADKHSGAGAGHAPVEGRNGVVVRKARYNATTPGYRTYEVHQRERVGESTEKIQPSQLVSDAYRTDPYPLFEILRSHYPCYRDWLSNSYWLTRYNDVTSVYADRANFEVRPRRWHLGLPNLGRDLGADVGVLTAQANAYDQHAESQAHRLLTAFKDQGGGDLAVFAGEYALALLCDALAIPDSQRGQFGKLYWQMQRGVSWQPQLQAAGQAAVAELRVLLEPLLQQRRETPGDDYLSALLQVTAVEQVDVDDVLATLLETDHQTLHGALANLFCLLLTHPDEFAKARSERRLMKLAYLETVRHSTPVLTAPCFARHEVERFGKLIPQGARVICAAAAANRDPEIFTDPERFIVDRKDMCQREPRGQYRADGLAAGITLALGLPSKHPAVPEDRPRSLYALTRDTASTAAMCVVEMLPDLKLRTGAEPAMTALTVGEMHTCWSLPISC